MAEYKEARTPRERGKQLSHMVLKEGEDGGHVVEHHYEGGGMHYFPPKEHVFGKDEGHELLKHIVKHGHIVISDEANSALEQPSEPEEPEEEGHEPAESEEYVESKANKGDRPYPGQQGKRK